MIFVHIFHSIQTSSMEIGVTTRLLVRSRDSEAESGNLPKPSFQAHLVSDMFVFLSILCQQLALHNG